MKLVMGSAAREKLRSWDFRRGSQSLSDSIIRDVVMLLLTMLKEIVSVCEDLDGGF